MKNLTISLGIFLGISVLVNIAVISRLSAKSRSENGNPTENAGGKAQGKKVLSLEKELAAERKEKECLTLLLKELKSLDQDQVAVTSDRNKEDAERENFRRVLRILLKAGDGDDLRLMDPAELAEAQTIFQGYTAAILSPSLDPDKYLRYITNYFDLMAEELGVPFSPGQKERLKEIADHLKIKLLETPTSPAVERLVGELEAQKQLVNDMSSLLTADQEKLFNETDTNPIFSPREKRLKFARNGMAEKAIVKDWSEIMDLQDHQLSTANIAAQNYVEDLHRLNERFGIKIGRNQNCDVKTMVREFEYRIESMQIQIKALELLERTLDESQRRGLDKKGVWEYHL